jgi:hypothetical protein
METVSDGRFHQLVVGRVKLDAIDAISEAVMGVQDRLIVVGLFRPLNRLRAAVELAE